MGIPFFVFPVVVLVFGMMFVFGFEYPLTLLAVWVVFGFSLCMIVFEGFIGFMLGLLLVFGPLFVFGWLIDWVLGRSGN